MGVYGGGVCRAQVHETNHRRVLVDPEMRPIPVVVPSRVVPSPCAASARPASGVCSLSVTLQIPFPAPVAVLNPRSVGGFSFLGRRAPFLLPERLQARVG